jgi:peroxiredoxin
MQNVNCKLKKPYMKNLNLFLFILITYTTFGQNKNGFSLQGKTKNISDGTILLLQNPLSNKFIDSVEVKNNTFIIKTALSNFPAEIILWRDGSTAKSIWVENKKITFDSSNSSFQDAIINGSITDSLATQLRKQTRELKSYEEIVANELEFIKNNPNNILSAHNLSIMANVFGKKKSTELFNNLSIENKQSHYGKIITNFLNLKLPETPKIGEKYFDFSMNNQKGEEKKLSEFDGKVILLEFWASWCLPCRKENPELVKTYDRFKKSGFEIFAVSLDENKENWVNAIKKDNLNWKHVSDLKGRNNLAALIYNVNGIPDNILIDKNGVIVSRNLRGEKLNKKLSKIFLKSGVEVKQN